MNFKLIQGKKHTIRYVGASRMHLLQITEWMNAKAVGSWYYTKHSNGDNSSGGKDINMFDSELGFICYLKWVIIKTFFSNLYNYLKKALSIAKQGSWRNSLVYTRSSQRNRSPQHSSLFGVKAVVFQSFLFADILFNKILYGSPNYNIKSMKWSIL